MKLFYKPFIVYIFRLIMTEKEISALILERNRLSDRFLVLIGELIRLEEHYKSARLPSKRAEYYKLLVEAEKERNELIRRQAELDVVLRGLGVIYKSRIEKKDPKMKSGENETLSRKRFLRDLQRKPK